MSGVQILWAFLYPLSAWNNVTQSLQVSEHYHNNEVWKTEQEILSEIKKRSIPEESL